jgi:CRP/FNR family cyclic AMP-dependent transcriptional regulator
MKRMKGGVGAMEPIPFDVLIDILRKTSLFQGLSAVQLATIADEIQIQRFPAHDRVMAMQEVGDAVFIILEGAVKIYTGSPGQGYVTLSIQGAGETLGEINAADELGHSAHVVTLEPSVLLRLERHVLTSFVQTMPELAHNLICLLARRLRLSTVHIHVLATGDTKSRLARLLLGLASQYNHTFTSGHADEPFEIPLRLKQADLADMIGTARPHLNKVWSALKRDGVISISTNQRITILNREALLRHCR